MIQYGKHVIDASDIAAVCDVMENRFLTQGPAGEQFESALCQYTGASYATVVNSATSALHVACLSLGVGSGDIVWTVPNSFIASANCALYCGASIDFVDIDPETRNLSVDRLQEKLDKAKAENRLPKAVVVVHFAGLSCDMENIRQCLENHNIAIIEDGSHALGGTYQGRPVGNCRYSDFCIFSFHPVKSITSAEGGALLTNNAALAKSASMYAKQGTTKDTASFRSLEGYPWEYEQQVLGYNFRLSDIHAVLGLSQMTKLDSFIQRRRVLADYYQSHLVDLPVSLPTESDNTESAWHIYVIELQRHNRAAVYQAFLEKGFMLNVHYIPIHLQPYYQELGFSKGDFPVSEAYYNMALTLPLYPGLTEAEQNSVIQILHEVLI